MYSVNITCYSSVFELTKNLQIISFEVGKNLEILESWSAQNFEFWLYGMNIATYVATELSSMRVKMFEVCKGGDTVVWEKFDV